MKNWKDNIYFILVEPKEPGNIGASARAIKNMGFRHLRIVNPPDDPRNEAAMFAHNAMDILSSLKSYFSLNNALSDMEYVVGTSRRRGRRRGVFTSVEKGSLQLTDIALKNKVGILFGREDRGLYNYEIENCGFLITIPANTSQPSLNIAQAVLIIAYELAKSGKRHPARDLQQATPPKLVGHKQLSHLFRRFEEALIAIDYIPKEDSYFRKKVMQNLRHCLERSGLTEWEFNMFQGICSSIDKKFNKG